MTYRAIVLDKPGGVFTAGIRELDERDLPPGGVTIRVEWSSVNYKDALAFEPESRVLKTYPMVPGVDIAGRVVDSSDPRFQPGDAVTAIGNDIGITHPGGFAELARLPGDWVVALPPGLTTKEAMAIGTAGFTAAQSIETLERYGLRTEQGPVMVTGATGGVGSTAVSMLAGLGYTVAASTGKAAEHAFLRGLGATIILSREEVSAESGKALDPERWAGAIDPVGGAGTAYLLRTMKAGSSIAISGAAGGGQLATTVYPFILRGVNLLGVNMVWITRELRERIWARLASDCKPRGLLESIAAETTLEGVPAAVAKIIAGEVRGRILVRL